MAARSKTTKLRFIEDSLQQIPRTDIQSQLEIKVARENVEIPGFAPKPKPHEADKVGEELEQDDRACGAALERRSASR